MVVPRVVLGSAFAVELRGTDAAPQNVPRDVLFLPFFAEASLSRHASQVRLRVVPLLPLISQNHRMVGVGRDLWRSSSPTSLLKQVHLEQPVQDHGQAGFE